MAGQSDHEPTPESPSTAPRRALPGNWTFSFQRLPYNVPGGPCEIYVAQRAWDGRGAIDLPDHGGPVTLAELAHLAAGAYLITAKAQLTATADASVAARILLAPSTALDAVDGVQLVPGSAGRRATVVLRTAAALDEDSTLQLSCTNGAPANSGVAMRAAFVIFAAVRLGRLVE
jgi:hypothetical protein